jgi:hypothetical protein
MTSSIDRAIYTQLFLDLENYQLTYTYNGEFTEQLTEQILGLVENSMNVESESSKTKKKVYFIMVESLQNITRHQSSKTEDYLLNGFFSIHKSPIGYFITSGNIVSTNNIEALKSKLDKLNSLSADELKTYHQELLTLGGFSEKGGAGLGLIEMLRKSGNKLQYDFIDINTRYSYFYFQTNVSISADYSESQANSKNLAIAKSLHTTIIKNNLKTIFHGQFGHENFKGILAMTENNLAGLENVKLKKTIIYVMIELMQNICFHADGKADYQGEGPGMFIVTDRAEGLALTTVNYLLKSKSEWIINYINEINQLDDTQARKRFLDILMQEHVKGDKGSGLGLLDIKIKTKNKIEVSTEVYSDELSYLVITANINF